MHALCADGFAALPERPISVRLPTMTRADLDALGQLLNVAATRGETWAAPRLRQWLATARGVSISTGQLGMLLRRERLRWERTKRPVRHHGHVTNPRS